MLGVVGIVAVIGGQDQQVVGAKPGQQFAQTDVESLEIGRVPRHVVPMAVLRIEVDQVREDQPAGRVADRAQDFVHPIVVGHGVNGRADSPSGEQILDLADRDSTGTPRAVRRSSSVSRRRRQRVVVAVGGPA